MDPRCRVWSVRSCFLKIQGRTRRDADIGQAVQFQKQPEPEVVGPQVKQLTPSLPASGNQSAGSTPPADSTQPPDLAQPATRARHKLQVLRLQLPAQVTTNEIQVTRVQL